MAIQDASVPSVRFARMVASFVRMSVIFASLAGCVSALDLDPSHSIAQYGHTAWTSQNGGLPGIVCSLTQTRDGWLWVGTEFGLFRFDGVKVSPSEALGGEPASDQTINALAQSPDGGLWIGTRKGVWHWNGSVHQHYTQWMASRKR